MIDFVEVGGMDVDFLWIGQDQFGCQVFGYEVVDIDFGNLVVFGGYFVDINFI